MDLDICMGFLIQCQLFFEKQNRESSPLLYHEVVWSEQLLYGMYGASFSSYSMNSYVTQFGHYTYSYSLYTKEFCILAAECECIETVSQAVFHQRTDMQWWSSESGLPILHNLTPDRGEIILKHIPKRSKSVLNPTHFANFYRRFITTGALQCHCH